MSPSKRRKRTISTRANVARLDEELAARAKRRKSEESAVSSKPKQTLTQMGLMGLRPDPCNPVRILQPLNPRPMRSDVVMIHGPPSLLLSAEDDASTPNKVPLTRQALRRDNEANSHPRPPFVQNTNYILIRARSQSHQQHCRYRHRQVRLLNLS